MAISGSIVRTRSINTINANKPVGFLLKPSNFTLNFTLVNRHLLTLTAYRRRQCRSYLRSFGIEVQPLTNPLPEDQWFELDQMWRTTNLTRRFCPPDIYYVRLMNTSFRLFPNDQAV